MWSSAGKTCICDGRVDCTLKERGKDGEFRGFKAENCGYMKICMMIE